MSDLSSRCRSGRIESVDLHERSFNRLSEREHAVQTVLAFGFMLVAFGASMAAACLLH